MAFIKKQTSQWATIRSALRTLHLWMGIGSGIILFVVCLTGTIYTFSDEINRALNSDLYTAASTKPDQKPLSAEEILQQVKEQKPGEKINSLTIPFDPSANWMVAASPAGKRDDTEKDNKLNRSNKGTKTEGAAKKEASSSINRTRPQAGPTRKGEGSRGTTYLVNPYTGEVKGTNQTGSSEFFLTIMKLHRWLLLSTETGRPIVGIATLIFCLLVISGLFIWVPAKAKMWRQGLTLKWNAGWKRRNHDLHNTLGFYAAIPLLIMGLTGLTWSFEWYNDGVRKMLGTYKPKGTPREETIHINPVIDGVNPLLIAKLITITDQQFNYSGNYRITLPSAPDEALNITKTKIGFFAPAAGDKITLHPFSGAILKKDVFRDKPFGERISSSIKALHVGNVFGGFTKILYLICCLIATSLPVTGTIIWINKLKKNKNRYNVNKVEKRESILV